MNDVVTTAVVDDDAAEVGAIGGDAVRYFLLHGWHCLVTLNPMQNRQTTNMFQRTDIVCWEMADR